MPPEPTIYKATSFATGSLFPIEVMDFNEYSHCCNKDVKTCCPLLPLPPGTVSLDSLNWLQDSYGVSMEDLQSWSVAFVPSGVVSASLESPYCCSASTGNYTCCAAFAEDERTVWLVSREVEDESFGQFVEVPSGLVQVWFDGDQRTRAVCSN